MLPLKQSDVGITIQSLCLYRFRLSVMGAGAAQNFGLGGNLRGTMCASGSEVAWVNSNVDSLVSKLGGTSGLFLGFYFLWAVPTIVGWTGNDSVFLIGK